MTPPADDAEEEAERLAALMWAAEAALRAELAAWEAWDPTAHFPARLMPRPPLLFPRIPRIDAVCPERNGTRRDVRLFAFGERIHFFSQFSQIFIFLPILAFWGPFRANFRVTEADVSKI